MKLLTKSLSEETRIRYADAAPVVDILVKTHPEDCTAVLQHLLGDSKGSPTSHNDIDEIVNFSAYWRNKWIAEKAATLPAGAKVLDAGAGQCQYKSLFAHAKYHAQDFAQYEGTEQGPLQESWNYAKLDYICDITQLPIEDGSFDAVVCTEVLEHVPDPIAALRELCRVTGPSGRLFLSAPLGSGIHQEPYHFYGGFSPYFYRKYLAEFGCEVVEIKPIGGLLRHVAQEVHRVARTMEAAQQAMSPAQRFVMMEWLPRLLSEMDDKCFVEQFTVGYLVEARKRVND
ncbi:class I SAM-dependent methyltransferase [Cupriavidus oxalaticus]|uniref:class I SAM-dependent methyltransferase n=1 Tax=Cupriavidus oxalaticus TaxID=96344 RepID=UPI00316F9079